MRAHSPSPRVRRPSAVAVLAALAAVGSAPAPAAARQDDDAWNGPRALELMRRARLARRTVAVDSALLSYEATAKGFVYFFIDRPDTDERTLIKADQVALELMWRAPNLTRQRIVGLRDRKLLPTNIRYHLDHLTVVQDDFGDWITLGDGDEVVRVLHPAGPGAEGIYDFRLADSLSIRYPPDREVLVYEVRVRPKAPDMPGFIGSVFLHRETAAIVRMSFTFTPVSYVDPYLDYIRISLDNALWMGRFWLPYRQEAEIRRELPVLDFMAGSVIRGRFEVGAYRFNTGLPESMFTGPRVTAAPERYRRTYPFERDILADLEEEGLAPPPSLEEVREEARRIVTDRALSGLGGVRLHVPAVSDVLRYNRAEGLMLAAGLHLRPAERATLRLRAGYAFARGRATWAARVTGAPERITPELEAYEGDLRDAGSLAGASPLLNSAAAALLGEDFLDPYFARGMRLTLRGPRPRRGPELALLFERHAPARLAVEGAEFAPPLPVDSGVVGLVRASLPAPLPAGGDARVEAGVGRMGDGTFTMLTVSARWQPPGGAERSTPAWEAFLDAGIVGGDAPVQFLTALGGRGTLPGHRYRSLMGSSFALARGALTLPLAHPWVDLRLFAAAGVSRLPARPLPPAWALRSTDGVRASIGAGLALGWDVLRLDLGRGIGPGGNWELTFSVAPRFHAWL